MASIRVLVSFYQDISLAMTNLSHFVVGFFFSPLSSYLLRFQGAVCQAYEVSWIRAHLGIYLFLYLSGFSSLLLFKKNYQHCTTMNTVEENNEIYMKGWQIHGTAGIFTTIARRLWLIHQTFCLGLPVVAFLLKWERKESTSIWAEVQTTRNKLKHRDNKEFKAPCLLQLREDTSAGFTDYTVRAR